MTHRGGHLHAGQLHLIVHGDGPGRCIGRLLLLVPQVQLLLRRFQMVAHGGLGIVEGLHVGLLLLLLPQLVQLGEDLLRLLLGLPDDPNEAAKALSYIRSQHNVTAEEVEYHA